MNALLSDPSFYAVAIPAVLLVGLSKGGFGGAMGFVGVPMMALVISPVQAAAILLPILVLMDIVSLWTWRGIFDRQILVQMLPGAMVGIGAGWVMAAVVTRRHGALHRRRGGDRLRRRAGSTCNFGMAPTMRRRRTASQPRSGARSPASPASSPMSADRPSRSTPCRCGSIRKS